MSEVIGEPDLAFLDGAERGAGISERCWIAVSGDYGWTVNDSPFDDYSRRAYILGHPGGLRDVISAQIGQARNNVGLDVAAGSNARALRDLIGNGTLGLGLATNLEDLMTEGVARDSRIHQVTGNLVHKSTWHDIKTWKDVHAPQGFALVMHRPVGGLQELSPHTYRGAAHFLLDLLRSEGLLFTQVPRSLVRSQQELAKTCTSIRSRQDVSEVLVTESRPPRQSVDERDMYAVVFKR